jgi:ferredoxin
LGYKRALIYFLSGTGNSFRVAMWLKDECRRRDISASVIPIDLAYPKTEIEASPEQLAVLAFPTHGLLPPWSAIKFLFKLPFRRRTHFFCLPTRGIVRIGHFIIPGIAGVASMFPPFLLALKGYSVRGSLSLDMPANMTSIMPSLRKKDIERILSDSKHRALKYYDRLLSGRSIWFTRNNLWEYTWGALLLYFFPFFPILYLLLGRFFMGKMMFANSDCIGCGKCARTCPNGAISMKGPKNPRPYWKYNCEDCLRCMNYCDKKAVEAGHSWAVILYFIATFSLSAYIFRFVAPYWPQIDYLKNYYTLEIVNAVYYYPAYFVAYFIFFELIRWKPLNALFTWTTLTHVFSRYHEPGTKLEDLTRKSE